MITTYFIKENKTDIVSEDNLQVIIASNIKTAAELITLLQSATTPYVAIADPFITFDRSVLYDAAALLERSRHAKALTTGYPVGEVSRQTIVPEPSSGLVVFKRDAVSFIDAGQTDPYNWIASFRLNAPNTLVASPVFYKRIQVLSEQAVPSPKRKIETNQQIPAPDNTIVVSVAAYAEPHKQADRLIRSARKFQIPIRFLSWGEPWRGFVYHKFYEFLKHVPQWKREGFRYAFVLDGFDVTFTDPLDVCCAKAAKYYPLNKLNFNREYPGRTFPYNEEWYRNLIINEGCHLNAGAVFGTFDMFEKVIGLALEIRQEMFEENTRPGALTQLMQDTTISRNLQRYTRDDQLLYQLTSLYYPQYFNDDTEKQVMSWVAAVGNRTLADLRKTPYKENLSIGGASIFHSSGSARRMDWTAWCLKEGLLVD